MDCWEFMSCGREEGGKNAQTDGVCPAYPDNGQRCANTVGTLCGGVIHCTRALRIYTCFECDFYKSEHHIKAYTIEK